MITATELLDFLIKAQRVSTGGASFRQVDGGYYIKETTEPKKSGNRVIEVTTWTINWESANSILGKEAEVPKEPLP